MGEVSYALKSLLETVHDTGRYYCPECDDLRKKHVKDLKITVTPDAKVYYCHHCRISGNMTTKQPIPKAPKPKVTTIPTNLNQSQQLITNFFSQRGVDCSDLSLEGKIVTDKRYFAQLNEKVDAIGFVYSVDDHHQAIKWRPADKNKKAFTQDGAARMLYGLTPLKKNQDRIIIVEGEADVIALASIGIEAYSHPNGAPIKVSKGRIDPQEDTKFSYVWEQWDELESAKEIVLATDRDTPGEALKQELARRLGLEKCWEIAIPEDCKDVTDVLKTHGSDALKNLFTNAKQMPLQGVYSIDDYLDELNELYAEGIASGESTGLEAVDELFTIKEGMMYIVTGYPGCGKSEFIDQITFNLSKDHHWKWAIASFENPPANHASKLIEKYTGRPFFDGPNQRTSVKEKKEAVDFIREHFVFLEQKDGSMASIESIISRIKLAIARCGVKGAVIDPYNYIDMSHYESEHIGITQMLSELSSFARAYGVAIFFVAHPQKIFPNSDGSMPVPKGSHISGSAAWWAKADIGFTVHRQEKHQPVQIHCWKARFKWLGQIGKADVGYTTLNGRYFDLESHKSWSDLDSKEWDDLEF
jgi:twinkle protein